MRVGILTFHRAINCGALLQCYALYLTLKSLDVDVSIIDYRPDFIEQYRKPFSRYQTRQIKGLPAKLKYYIKSFLNYAYYLHVWHKYDSFLSQIELTPIVEAEQIGILGFDAIVVGSDQVWNLQITDGLDKVYWGNFEKKLLITYAASLGQGYDSDMADAIKDRLRSFNAISVREDYAREMLQKLTEKKVFVVPDPTLLINTSYYYYSKPSQAEDGYVLYYALDKTETSLDFAKNIAHQLGLKLIMLRAGFSVAQCIPKKGYKLIQGISPKEFCGYVKYAKCIINHSFHGTVFSILYKKDFYSLECKSDGRYRQLLKDLGLQDRLVSPSNSIEFSHVDYSGIDLRIKLKQNVGIDFLKKSLNL